MPSPSGLPALKSISMAMLDDDEVHSSRSDKRRSIAKALAKADDYGLPLALVIHSPLG